MIAQFTSSGGHEGGEAAAEVIDKAASLTQYTEVYTQMGLITVGIGVLLLIVSPFLNKMMHGIR
ncbi:MAG: hypothetical protein R3B47_03090 [Bacteroidia bacterium]